MAQIRDGVVYMHCWGCGADVSAVLDERSKDIQCGACTTVFQLKYTKTVDGEWMYSAHGVVDYSERHKG